MKAAAASVVAGPKAPSASDRRIVITLQYRDLRGLTYELSCGEKLLTLRFAFPIDEAHGWQVEAQLRPGTTSPVSAGAMTRTAAFRGLVDAWASAGNQLAAPELDWESVATALRAVRAL